MSDGLTWDACLPALIRDLLPPGPGSPEQRFFYTLSFSAHSLKLTLTTDNDYIQLCVIVWYSWIERRLDLNQSLSL